jgi:hypothetical protein
VLGRIALPVRQASGPVDTDLDLICKSGNTVFEPGKEGSHYKGSGSGSGDKEEEKKGENKNESVKKD